MPEHTENVNDDLLIQAISDIALGEEADGSCGAFTYRLICGVTNSMKLKSPVNVKFFTTVADNFSHRRCKGQ